MSLKQYKLPPMSKQACGCGEDYEGTKEDFVSGRATHIPTKLLGAEEGAKEILTYLAGAKMKAANLQDKGARFEAGVSADPTKNMSPEDAQTWQEMNEKHRDNFKMAKNLPTDVERYVKEVKESNPDYDDAKTWATAWSIYCKNKNPDSPHCQKDSSEYFKKATQDLATKWAEGCPSNLDPSECKEWEDNTEKYKDVVKNQHHAALYPSSPRGTKPLSDSISQDVWDAGYEAASYASTNNQHQVDGTTLFLGARDKRIPRGINESHPQFWEYLGTFVDGAKAFAENDGRIHITGGPQATNVQSSSPSTKERGLLEFLSNALDHMSVDVATKRIMQMGFPAGFARELAAAAQNVAFNSRSLVVQERELQQAIQEIAAKNHVKLASENQHTAGRKPTSSEEDTLTASWESPGFRSRERNFGLEEGEEEGHSPGFNIPTKSQENAMAHRMQIAQEVQKDFKEKSTHFLRDFHRILQASAHGQPSTLKIGEPGMVTLVMGRYSFDPIGAWAKFFVSTHQNGKMQSSVILTLYTFLDSAPMHIKVGVSALQGSYNSHGFEVIFDHPKVGEVPSKLNNLQESAHAVAEFLFGPERNKQASISLRVTSGTRVVVNANPASRTLYTDLPADGEEGVVTPVSFGTTKRTFMPGPGGGLVYVKFDNGEFMGVSPKDLDKAPKKGQEKKAAEESDKDAKFEEGVSADPTKNMSPEDAAEWKKQNEANKDNFKQARQVNASLANWGETMVKVSKELIGGQLVWEE